MLNNKPSAKKRALTGIQPSGNVHIGNYLGMLKPALELQQEYDCIYFIADLHSLTTVKDGAKLQAASLDLVATWLALGLDVSKHIFFRQSDVANVTEFAWYLSCFTGLGLLEKAHALKEKRDSGLDVNHGLLAYPVLMAADIVMYDVDVVPVGKDQKQHVEMARDMAGSVNSVLSKDLIKLPSALIKEEVMIIPGLDGRKMSKSYGNEIPLFCEQKQLRKKVLSLITDSTPLEAPKSMKDTVLGQLYCLFASKQEYDQLELKLNQGGLGWGHAKEELFLVIDREISKARGEYFKLRKDEGYLFSVLSEGAVRAASISRPILNRLRTALGFSAQ